MDYILKREMYKMESRDIQKKEVSKTKKKIKKKCYYHRSRISHQGFS